LLTRWNNSISCSRLFLGDVVEFFHFFGLSGFFGFSGLFCLFSPSEMEKPWCQATVIRYFFNYGHLECLDG